MTTEMVISTPRLNCYGTRVLTEGISTEQYLKNPILLWMHKRAYEDDALPIGRVDNLRVEGDALIGTPVFDSSDEFARKIENKWNNGFLKMCSPCFEIVETTCDPQYLEVGQTRETISKSRLIEVSIVDIGANDDALQLAQIYSGGKYLKLSSDMDSTALPLLYDRALKEVKLSDEPAEETPEAPEVKTDTENIDNSKPFQMNEELLKMLDLPLEATEQDVLLAVSILKDEAAKVAELQLAGISAVVDEAIKDRRINAANREHFITLGKTAGIDFLTENLSLFTPKTRMTDCLHMTADNVSGKKELSKLSDATDEEIQALRRDDPEEYQRLYKAEYGIDITVEKEDDIAEA